MTLKELRESLGLTQSECAEYLGMTLRNYQNYENNVIKNKAKNNAIFRKLEQCLKISNNDNEYNTNIVTGSSLEQLCSVIRKYEKRECFQMLKSFIENDYYGKICILYGLRRTGKTTLLFQAINELNYEQSVYIKIKTTDTMSGLIKDLNKLYNNGYKYIFIDEITLLKDFIDTAATLSDIFGIMGMKIILSGTDSLGFAMANRDELYDRNIMIHTSFISFKEYARVLNLDSIDKYIEYGGTLKMENMSFDDPDYIRDEVSFRDDETTRKYIDTAISRNIQHTLKNDRDGIYFNQFKELYEENELTNVINRIVENMNHEFLVKVVEEKFKSHDYDSAKNLMLHDSPLERAYVLENKDLEQMVIRLKKIVEIKDKHETKIKVTQEHIDKIKKYLKELDLIVDSPIRYESGSREEYYIFSQPGMRYVLAKALVYSLLQDSYFNAISEYDKTYIINKILNDVKGRMMEDIVLLEVNKSKNKNKEAFKFKFDLGGEFDMIIYNKETNTNEIYEIKHTDKIIKYQTRHLLDNDKCEYVSKRYGKTTRKCVIYRGPSTKVDEVNYINVERFLKNL